MSSYDPLTRTTTDLGTLGGDYSVANGMDTTGTIVGISGIAPAGPEVKGEVYHAFARYVPVVDPITPTTSTPTTDEPTPTALGSQPTYHTAPAATPVRRHRAIPAETPNRIDKHGPHRLDQVSFRSVNAHPVW